MYGTRNVYRILAGKPQWKKRCRTLRDPDGKNGSTLTCRDEDQTSVWTTSSARVKKCDLAAECHNREFHQLNNCLRNSNHIHSLIRQLNTYFPFPLYHFLDNRQGSLYRRSAYRTASVHTHTHTHTQNTLSGIQTDDPSTRALRHHAIEVTLHLPINAVPKLQYLLRYMLNRCHSLLVHYSLT